MTWVLDNILMVIVITIAVVTVGDISRRCKAIVTALMVLDRKQDQIAAALRRIERQQLGEDQRGEDY